VLVFTYIQTFRTYKKRRSKSHVSFKVTKYKPSLWYYIGLYKLCTQENKCLKTLYRCEAYGLINLLITSNDVQGAYNLRQMHIFIIFSVFFPHFCARGYRINDCHHHHHHHRNLLVLLHMCNVSWRVCNVCKQLPQETLCGVIPRAETIRGLLWQYCCLTHEERLLFQTRSFLTSF
jgi:hypothetical protein